MSSKLRSADALAYHSEGRKGKIEVVPTKPCRTQRDLSLAYTPGVAEVCRAIEADAAGAFEYTARGNLVGVISNGTAVLGLGDIGPLAAKPVMEGKAVLFKRFADIDVFDIEIAEKDPEKLIEIIAALEPTFGGINLEDIKAPECFTIEQALIERMDIPVFHDDQHGTAIISAAALINALILSNRQIEDVSRIVVAGAGAASIACVKLFEDLGLRHESVWMYDSKGLIHDGRSDLNAWKQEFARSGGDVSLAEAMRGADMFIGVSSGGTMSAEMVKSMAPNPIVFAMANPDPEISYPDAVAVRDDIIMATGRSDYPNQVNNVLGFPFIFRGALDVYARRINTEMKLAAAHSLAELARESVPENVIRAYGGRPITFGPEYIIPKPFDHRVLLWVAPAVARAAMETGVARRPIEDFEAYQARLETMLAPARGLIRTSINRSKDSKARPRVVFAEGDEARILKAIELVMDDDIIEPIVLGPRDRIEQRISELGLSLGGLQILDHFADPALEGYVDRFMDTHHRRGFTRQRAWREVRRRTTYASMMVADGRADIFVGGMHRTLETNLRNAVDLIGLRPDVPLPVGVSALVLKGRLLMFADTAVTSKPTPEQLVSIARRAVEGARMFSTEPRVAFIGASNFGARDDADSLRLRRAVEILDASGVDFAYEGEMTVDIALNAELRSELYPHGRLDKDANVLIFPNLAAAHAAMRLLAVVGGAEVLGPVYRGFRQPVVILGPTQSASEICNLVAMAAGKLAALRAAGLTAG